ncbi:MAG: hypothetical protein L0Y72_06775 [Gemmataceae bacterium]|nr:hypothetical protein [Gemmataceae bacterium]MCI0738728.1 hypothetical protein [Gemmataceae bacterium]
MRLIVASVLTLFALDHSQAQAQRPAESVRFESPDGVRLRGLFYPAVGAKSPCVLLVHELGQDSRRRVWKKLAAKMQAEGYAVLAFDLRGHGESVEVDADKFWANAFRNRARVRSTDPNAIDFQKFDKRYYPVLANDIASAKAYLDLKNDARECNSSNLVIVGAGTGATLAALWMNAEWHRYRYFPATVFEPVPRMANTPEGENLMGAAFVDCSSTLGSRRVNLPAVLEVPGRIGKTPLVLLYGADNEASGRVASALEKSLKRNGQALPFTAAVTIPDAGDQEGSQLLAAESVQSAIIDYVDNVKENRAREWEEKVFRNALYVWRLPFLGNQIRSANTLGERTLLFNTYEGFLPSR